MIRRLTTATVLLGLVACAGQPTTSGRVTESRLQQQIGPGQLTPEQIGGEVGGFADQYVALLTHAYDRILEQPLTPAQRATTGAFLLNTAYGAFTIASDPNPIVAFFDMAVLVGLTEKAAEAHWSDVLTADLAEPLLFATRRGREDIWKIAEKVLDADQRQDLSQLIEAWWEENGEVRDVALVRFGDFAESRRQLHATQSGPKSVFGLFGLDPLAGVDPAIRELERSRMLAERTFYYAKRLPILVGTNAMQIYMDIAATAEAEQLRSNVQTFADVAQELSVTARELPDDVAARVTAEREATVAHIRQVVVEERDAAIAQIQVAVTAERTAAIDQVMAGIRSEREAIVALLEEEEPVLRGMLSEVRQTVESTTQLVQTVQEIMPPPDPDRTPNPDPISITDVHGVLEQTTTVAGGFTELVQTMDRALAPDDLAARLVQFDQAIGQAQAHGQSLIDRSIMRAGIVAACIVVLIFVLSVTRLLIQRRLNPAPGGR